MKILHINDNYNQVGGTESHLLSLISGLEDKGIENVVAHQNPTILCDHRKKYCIRDLTDFSIHPSTAAMRSLKQILRKENPDLVHLHNVGNDEVSKICLEKIPTIKSIHVHSSYCPGQQKYFPLTKSVCTKPFGPLCVLYGLLTHCISYRPNVMLEFYLHSLKSIDTDKRFQTLLIASRYVRDCMIQNGFSSKLLNVIPYYTDLPKLLVSDKKDNNLLFIGRIRPEKGLSFLLRSLKYLDVSCRLIVCGDGAELEKMKRLTYELDLKDRVCFVGWVSKEEKNSYYRQASIVIVPSIWPEPFGIVGIEAMSYGKPVVAFNVGGIPDWLDDKVTGFLVNPYDIKEMAEKIRYLLENPNIAHAMGIRGRKRVEEDFVQDKCIEKIIKIYDNAILSNKNGKNL